MTLTGKVNFWDKMLGAVEEIIDQPTAFALEQWVSIAGRPMSILHDGLVPSSRILNSLDIKILGSRR